MLCPASSKRAPCSCHPQLLVSISFFSVASSTAGRVGRELHVNSGFRGSSAREQFVEGEHGASAAEELAYLAGAAGLATQMNAPLLAGDRYMQVVLAIYRRSLVPKGVVFRIGL